jgi:hypothetical protein
MSKSKPYNKWLKEQLSITKTKVHRWFVWDEDADVYQAYIESRRVAIPTPECDWSFLVCLHEIGHVSTGYRLHSYLMEYNAEKWAIKRAKEAYDIYLDEYVLDAKQYVKMHLVENLLFSELKVDKVKPYVLSWLDETPKSIADHIIKLYQDNLIDTSFHKVDLKYWSNISTQLP